MTATGCCCCCTAAVVTAFLLSPFCRTSSDWNSDAISFRWKMVLALHCWLHSTPFKLWSSDKYGVKMGSSLEKLWY